MNDDKVLLLKRHPCARGLSDEALEEIAQAAELIHCEQHVCGIAFDIDKTLYDNDAYARHQIEILIERLAKERATSIADCA